MFWAGRCAGHRRRMPTLPPFVIARSTCDEAIHLSVCRSVDCFAEPVIERHSRDPVARNDTGLSSQRGSNYKILPVGGDGVALRTSHLF